jgi:hypothetical protein
MILLTKTCKRFKEVSLDVPAIGLILQFILPTNKYTSRSLLPFQKAVQNL